MHSEIINKTLEQGYISFEENAIIYHTKSPSKQDYTRHGKNLHNATQNLYAQNIESIAILSIWFFVLDVFYGFMPHFCLII